MPSTYRDVDFGQPHAGIATVGYTVRDTAGAVVVARTTAGVFEIGAGKYGASLTVPAGLVGSIFWDTAPGSAVTALERIDLAEATRIADTVLRRRAAAVQASADGDPLALGSLYGTVQQAQKAAVAGSTLSVLNPDGTVLGTLALAVTPGADPVSGVG